jgi:glycosyltransferase involved in cell wall biosynthesis
MSKLTKLFHDPALFLKDAKLNRFWTKSTAPNNQWVNVGRPTKFRPRKKINIIDRYLELFDTLPIDSRSILYESYQGRSISSNPLAIYVELAKSPAFSEFQHIWVLDEKFSSSVEYQDMENVEFVQRHSDQYQQYLCSCKYLINNATFPSYFLRKKGQFYLSTWDGSPLANVNEDEQDSFKKSMQRNLIQSTHLLSKNDTYTKTILSSIGLENIYSGKYLPLNDDSTTARVVDSFFGKKESSSDIEKEKKKKNILFYCGGFKNNGITTSALNLFNCIDYDKYNVILIKSSDYHPDQDNNFKKLNSRANLISAENIGIASRIELKTLNKYYSSGKLSKKTDQVLQNYFEREKRRLVGDLVIDVAVDFSGYNKFWTLMFRFVFFPRKAIYQHNDMAAETNKVVNGKLKHKDNLRIIFAAYKHFDKIVSVSAETKDLNFQNLNHIVQDAKNKFCYVTNCINYEAILKQANIKKCAQHSPNPDYINFINVARFSPEKRHDKLIYAFNKLCKKYSHAMLYLVGDGDLFEQTQALVNSLEIKQNVIFTGHIDNPYVLINICDCFVLASDHEGQPMVLLEALTLGKPIIATNIVGSRSVIGENLGTLVDNSSEGLYNGMLNFANKPFIGGSFDYLLYQRQTMDLFYQEVCGGSRLELETKHLSIHS